MKKGLILFTSLFAVSMLTGCGKTDHVHNYDKNNIQWNFKQASTGGYSASATFSCLDCAAGTEGHFKEVPGGVTRTVHEPTCTKNGEAIYTASVNFENNVYTKEKVETIDKKGHHFQDVYSSDENYHFHKCEDCDERQGQEAHTTSSSYEHNGTHHWKVCDICEGQFTYEAHSADEVIDDKFLASEPTCTKNKTYYKSCSKCGEATEYTFEVPGTMLSHQFVEHAAKEAESCQKPGNKLYYTCSRCGDGHYFLNNTDPHASEVSWSEIILTKEHNMSEHARVEPTCEQNGHTTYYTCAYADDENIYKDNEGKETYASLEETVLEKIGHSFNEEGKCIHEGCNKTIKEAYGFESVNEFDSAPKKTLTGMSLSASETIAHNENKWGRPDFVSNPESDIYFKFNYQKTSGAFSRFYFFNNADEAGLTLMINYNRDDGIAECRVYTNSTFTYGPKTTVIADDTTTYYFPRISSFKPNQDNIVNVRYRLIDQTTNTYRFEIRGGQDLDHLYDLTTAAETKTNVEKYFDLELDNYTPDVYNKIRINSKNASLTIKDSGFPTMTGITYKTDSDVYLGKKNYEVGDEIVLPQITKANSYFIGWFNQEGKEVTKGYKYSKADTITARFVEKSKGTVTLSNFGYEADNWMIPEDSITSKQITSIEEGTSRFDVYFLLDVITVGTSIPGIGTYVIFTFPISGINFRLNTNVYTNGINGYFAYNKTIVEANRFNMPNLTYNGSILLIHLYIEDIGDGKGNVGFEVTSMANGNFFGKELSSVNLDSNYSFKEVKLNTFTINRENDTSTLKIKNTF